MRVVFKCFLLKYKIFLLGGGRRERAKLKRMFIVELHEAFQFKLFAFIFTRSFKQRVRNR